MVRKGTKKPYSREKYQSKVTISDEKRGNGYYAVVQGEEGSFYLKVTCPEGHSYNYGTMWTYIKDGSTCKECNRIKRMTPYKEVEQWFSKNGDVLVTPDNLYQGSSRHVNYICVACGKQHSVIPYSYKYGGYRTCNANRFKSGEEHPNYKPELTEEYRTRRRMRKEDKEWTQQVLCRDEYTCKKCLSKGATLHAHHIFPYSSFPDKRTEMSNGITLCHSCHFGFHQEFGKSGEQPRLGSDWRDSINIFLAKCQIPPRRKRVYPKGKRDEGKGVVFPAYSWCPQQIFEKEGKLYSTIPDFYGYLISEDREVIGKLGRKLDKSSFMSARDNSEVPYSLNINKVADSLFQLRLSPKPAVKSAGKVDELQSKLIKQRRVCNEPNRTIS